MTRLTHLMLALPLLAGLGACGEGDAAAPRTSTGPTTSAPAGRPATTGDTSSDPEVQRWIDNWCSVRMSTTKDQAIELMGDPTSTADTALTWRGSGYTFIAKLGPDATVTGFEARSDNPPPVTPRRQDETAYRSDVGCAGRQLTG